MRFTAVAVAAGLLIGLLRGGRPSDVGRRALRWWPALFVGIVAQALPESVEVDRAAVMASLAASYASLTAFALANLRLTGMPVVLVGLLLNAVVILSNGGMPVRADAIRAAGLGDPVEVDSLDFGTKRHLEDDEDRLMVLADIIPVRPLREVLSFGDLILALGIGDVVFRLLRRPPRAGDRTKVDLVALEGAPSPPKRSRTTPRRAV